MLSAAQSRQRISLSNLFGQQHTELSQQLVAGDVSTGIVDDLELIEVEVTQGVLGILLASEIDQMTQALLELAPVDEPRQRVMARLVGELL